MTAQLEHVPTVVLYDVLREAATRVKGRILALAEAEGGDEARRRAIAEIVAIGRRVDDVEPTDREAIGALDAELRDAYSKLPSA